MNVKTSSPVSMTRFKSDWNAPTAEINLRSIDQPNDESTNKFYDLHHSSEFSLSLFQSAHASRESNKTIPPIEVRIINQNVISKNYARHSQGSKMLNRLFFLSILLMRALAPGTMQLHVFFLLSRKDFELGVNINNVISHDENKRNCIRHKAPSTMTTTTTTKVAAAGAESDTIK